MDETRQRLDELLDIENRDEVAVYHNGNLVLLDTREARFFEAWKVNPDYIIDASQVRRITSAAYCREIYYRDWMKQEAIGLARGGQVRPLYDMCRITPAKDYYLEGLEARTQLFAKETHDCIQFRFLTDPDLAKHSEGRFKIGDKVCTYHDWQKGYLLARMRFGETKAGRSSSQKIVGKYCGDIEFVKRRYSKEAEGQGRRRYRRVSALKWFARLWDVFFIPLRYFGHESAFEFSKEYLEYSGEDLPTFRRVFLYGGGGRDGYGLKLNPVKPYVVTKWTKNAITISSEAAKHHGFHVDKLSEELRKYFKRRVYLR
jgi:hypothetical protein